MHLYILLNGLPVSLKHILGNLFIIAISLCLSQDINAQACCENLISNGSFEDYPSSFTFPTPFENIPSQTVNQGDWFASNWISATGGDNDIWLIQDNGNQVNNPDGSHFIFMRGQNDCAQLCGNPADGCDVEPLLCEPWDNGSTYELCFTAAAWSENFSGDIPSGPGTQVSSNIVVEVARTSGITNYANTSLPASSSFTNLNWTSNCATFMYDASDPIETIYLTQTGTGGITLDNITVKNLNDPCLPLNCSTSLSTSETCVGNDGALSVTAIGGSGTYSYQWNNGATTSSITGLSSGNYFVTITDSEGDTAECNYYVPNNCSSQECNDYTIIVDSWNCSTACDSAVPICGLDFASTSDACYTDTADFIDPLGAASGCFNQISVSVWMAAADANYTKDPNSVVQINKSYPLEINGVQIGMVNPLEIAYTCNVCDFQQVTFTVNPLDVNYNYGGSNTLDINFKSENTPNFVQAICIAQVELGFCSSPGPTCSITKFEDITCNGQSDGTATALATSENGGFTYLWDNGETTATAVALTAGTHDVTVTDNFGCESICSVDINEPDALTCSTEIIEYESCNCTDDGVAKVIPVGGNGGYTYLWSNGETSQTAIALGEGMHTVTITDAKNCQTICDIEMLEDPDCCYTVMSNGFLTSFPRSN